MKKGGLIGAIAEYNGRYNGTRRPAVRRLKSKGYQNLYRLLKAEQAAPACRYCYAIGTRDQQRWLCYYDHVLSIEHIAALYGINQNLFARVLSLLMPKSPYKHLPAFAIERLAISLPYFELGMGRSATVKEMGELAEKLSYPDMEQADREEAASGC